MKHQIKIEISNTDKTELIFKLEEFLREYWGNYEFLIHFLERTEKNTEILTQDSQPGFTEFYAFQNKNDFQFLIENNLEKTPRKVEIFRFDLSKENLLDISFYNSADTFDRERQFQKIISQIKDCLLAEITHVRITSGKIEYKHRRNDGYISIQLIPCYRNDLYWDKSIMIFEEDFIILYDPVKKIFESKEEKFDWTSYNDIEQNEWEILIKEWEALKTGKRKQDYFINTIINWSKEQITFCDSLRFDGNL